MSNSDTIRVMPLLPKCNEGFRRLGIVVAMLVCIAGIGLAAFAYNDNQGSAMSKCSPKYATEYSCDGVSIADCKAQRAESEQTCLATSTWSPSVWVLWLLGIAFVTYIGALIVHTIGWIVQGFFLRN